MSWNELVLQGPHMPSAYITDINQYLPVLTFRVFQNDVLIGTSEPGGLGAVAPPPLSC